MTRIAEILEFMKARAIKVCAKVGIERKVGHKNHVFVKISNKVVLKEHILDSSK